MYSKQADKGKGNTKNIKSNQVIHYSNGLYMGGTINNNRHGVGLILHDNGTSAITNYYQNVLHEHNIFFKNNCIASINYNKGKLEEVVYRTDGFLVNMSYNEN